MSKKGARGYWPEEWPDWPNNRKARKAIAGLYDLGLEDLNAPASLRKSRLQQADEKSRYYLSKLSEDEQERAKDLVAVWQQSALIQQSIRWEEKKKGLKAVEHLLPRWYTAGRRMQQAEEEALQLGLMGHEYFKNCMDYFNILQEEKDEVGEYHGLPDHSELRDQWYSRKPITVPLPWPWEEMLLLCKEFENKDDEDKRRPLGRKLTILGIVLTIVLGAAGILVTVLVDKF